MIKVYIYKIIDKKPYLDILYPNLGVYKGGGSLNVGVFNLVKDPFVEIVLNPLSADFFLIPHSYFLINNLKDYIFSFVSLARKYNKKIIVIATGDKSDDISIPNSIVLRMSQYKQKLKSNEIIIPAYIHDLGFTGVGFREKSSTIPIVGFCGWADFSNNFQKIKFSIKNILIHIYKGSVYKKGVYFRRKVIKAFLMSSKIQTNFIIRKTYSGNTKTLALPIEIAEKEYRENIISSDFVLVVKGDGNYSNRFYEVLSLGRIPILIDTDTPLPLENEIDYSKFVLRVSWREIKNTPNIVSNFYKSLTSKEFKSMQQEARNIFEKKLNPVSFYRNLFQDKLILSSTI